MKIQLLKTQEHATEICLPESESSIVYRKLGCDKMGRAPVCYRERPQRGAWTMQEDSVLIDYINAHGAGQWSSLPKRAGLERSGKSCRLRWMNHLRPDIKRGNISPEEEELIIRMHRLLGDRWSLIAGRLPGLTGHEIKNYWNTHICKKLADGIMNDESVGTVSNKTTFEINYQQTTVRRYEDSVTKDCFNHPIKDLLSVDSVDLNTSNLLLDFDPPLPPPEFSTDFSIDDCEINGTMAIVDLA